MPVNTTLSPGWKNAVNVIPNQKTFGDILTKDYLITQFQLNKLNGLVTEKEVQDFAFDFMEQMGHFKEEMLFQHNMCVFSIGSGQYKILDPAEQTDKNWAQMIRKVRRILYVTGRNISNIHLVGMSNHDRTNNVNKQAALAGLKVTLSQGLRNASNTNINSTTTNQSQPMSSNSQITNPGQGNSPNTP